MEEHFAIIDELELLRHAHLPESFTFALEGGRSYFADLATQATALSPAYRVHDAGGNQLGQVVLPSILQSVELHLLAWITIWDHATHGQCTG